MNREWLNHRLKEETRAMRILALDPGKYKSVASQLRNPGESASLGWTVTVILGKWKMKNLIWKMENPVFCPVADGGSSDHGIFHISFSICHFSFE